MLDKDWTGTAAAVTALALSAGAWLWPEAETPAPSPAAHPSGQMQQMTALDAPDGGDMARWQAEARRWHLLEGGGDVQLSSANGLEPPPPVIR